MLAGSGTGQVTYGESVFLIPSLVKVRGLDSVILRLIPLESHHF